MATGTVKWFAQALLDLGNKIHDLDSDVLKIGFVSAATVPAVGTAAPHWGGTGTTNFAANQVSTSGTAYTGPVTLTGLSWSLVAGVPTFRAGVVTLAADAAGPANIAYGIVYNDSDTNKRAIAFVEVSAAASASLVSGQLVVDWSGATNDILTLTQS